MAKNDLYDYSVEPVDAYLYIYHINNGKGKWFNLPAIPDTVQDTMKSTFTETNALSRSAPIYTYANSGPREVEVTLQLARDLLTDVNIGNGSISLEPGEDVIEDFIRSIQSIAVPKYRYSSKAVQPPLVYLRLGKEIEIRGVVNGGVNVTYKKPILSDGKYSFVDISFRIQEIDPYDAEEVAEKGSFRCRVRPQQVNSYEE